MSVTLLSQPSRWNTDNIKWCQMAFLNFNIQPSFTGLLVPVPTRITLTRIQHETQSLSSLKFSNPNPTTLNYLTLNRAITHTLFVIAIRTIFLLFLALLHSRCAVHNITSHLLSFRSPNPNPNPLSTPSAFPRPLLSPYPNVMLLTSVKLCLSLPHRLMRMPFNQHSGRSSNRLVDNSSFGSERHALGLD